MRGIISSFVVTAFCLTASPSFAQLGGLTEGAKKAGSVTKEAGKTTVDTAKKGVDAAEKGTKKVASETKDAVQTTYRCADGKTDRAALKKDACRDHGGVKAEKTAKPRY
jgi:hypothetical protein